MASFFVQQYSNTETFLTLSVPLVQSPPLEESALWSGSRHPGVDDIVDKAVKCIRESEVQALTRL